MTLPVASSLGESQHYGRPLLHWSDVPLPYPIPPDATQSRAFPSENIGSRPKSPDSRPWSGKASSYRSIRPRRSI